MPLGFTIGALYVPNYNGIAWSQPGGTGTTVLPPQNDGQFAGYPILGNIISEAGESLWRLGCGHGFDTYQVFRDYDMVNQISAAIVCCPLCSFIGNVYEPYEVIYNTVTTPYILA